MVQLLFCILLFFSMFILEITSLPWSKSTSLLPFNVTLFLCRFSIQFFPPKTLSVLPLSFSPIFPSFTHRPAFQITADMNTHTAQHAQKHKNKTPCDDLLVYPHHHPPSSHTVYSTHTNIHTVSLPCTTNHSLLPSFLPSLTLLFFMKMGVTSVSFMTPIFVRHH